MSAASDTRDRAEEMLAATPTAPRAVCTDAHAVPGKVLIGIAIRGVGACVAAVSAAEWNESWERNIGLLG